MTELLLGTILPKSVDVIGVTAEFAILTLPRVLVDSGSGEDISSRLVGPDPPRRKRLPSGTRRSMFLCSAAMLSRVGRSALRGLGLGFVEIGVVFVPLALFGVSNAFARLLVVALAAVFVGWGVLHWFVVFGSESEEQLIDQIEVVLSGESVVAAFALAIGVVISALDYALDSEGSNSLRFIAWLLVVVVLLALGRYARSVASPRRVVELVVRRVGPVLVFPNSAQKAIDQVQEALNRVKADLDEVETLGAEVTSSLLGACDAGDDGLFLRALEKHARRVGLIYYVQDVYVRGLISDSLDALPKPTHEVRLVVVPLMALVALIRTPFQRQYQIALMARRFRTMTETRRQQLDKDPLDQPWLQYSDPASQALQALQSMCADGRGDTKVADLEKVLSDWYPGEEVPSIDRYKDRLALDIRELGSVRKGISRMAAG